MARKWKENQNQRGVGAIVGSGATVSRPVVVCKVKKRKVKVKVRRSTSRTSQENQTRQSATPVQMPPALVKPAIQIAEEIPELDEIPCIEYPPSTYCHLTNVVHTTASEERHSSTQACGDLTSISRQTPSQQKSSRDEQIKTMSTRIHDPVEEKPRTIKPASPTKIPRHVPEPQAEPKIRDIVSDILHPGIVWDLHTLAKGSNALSLLFQNFNPNCFVSQADRPVDLPDHVYEKYDLRRPNVVAIPRSQTEIANPLTHTYKTFRNDFSNRSLAVPPFVASFSPNSPPSLPLQYQTCPMPIPYQPIRDTAVFADAPKDSYLLLSPPHIALLKKQYSEPTIRDLEQERSSTNDEERGSSGRQLSSSASNRYQTQRNCYSVLSKAGSLLRNASNGGGKMAMEIKLGGLGPDKDNDAYKTGVETNF